MADTATLTMSLTYSELITLINSGGLKKGASYTITDRGITVVASSYNKIETNAFRTMLCPSDYAIHTDAYGNSWKGVWNSSKSFSTNDLAIWGGLVHKNLTGLVGTKVDDFSLDPVNWIVIPKTTFTNHEYIEMTFGVQYDVFEDWINKQWDTQGNILGMGKSYFLWWYSPVGDPINLIDACDWNYRTSGKNFNDNVCAFFYNNSLTGDVYYNNVLGSIYNNSCTDIYFNTCHGSIFDNLNTTIIVYNSNLGDINGNNNNISAIWYNSNMGYISDNSTKGEIYKNRNVGSISNNSCNAEDTVNIYNNINNGRISGIWHSDVTDTVVDKTGTA